MCLQVFFRNLLLHRLVEESIEVFQFIFARPLGDDRDEVDKFGVINWTVKLPGVLNHQEDFVGEIRVLDGHQPEVLEQLALANHIVFRKSVEFFLNLRQFLFFKPTLSLTDLYRVRIVSTDLLEKVVFSLRVIEVVADIFAAAEVGLVGAYSWRIIVVAEGSSPVLLVSHDTLLSEFL